MSESVLDALNSVKKCLRDSLPVLSEVEWRRWTSWQEWFRIRDWKRDWERDWARGWRAGSLAQQGESSQEEWSDGERLRSQLLLKLAGTGTR